MSRSDRDDVALSIGFTGTRHGMTTEQLDAVRVLLVLVAPPDAIFHAHHGDCVGADEQFHKLCRNTNGRGYIIVHPGPLHDVANKAGCLGDERNAGRPHMARNRDIVDASTVMLAAPLDATEQQRGGTWATIRMARRAGKPLAIVLPSGEVVRERWVIE